jgi:hypothetical protein
MDDTPAISTAMQEAIDRAKAERALAEDIMKTTTAFSFAKQHHQGQERSDPLQVKYAEDIMRNSLASSPATDPVRKSHAAHRVRPIRIEMLAEGMDLTWGDRDKEYGDPAINGACAGELKAVLRKWVKRDMTPAEQEFLEMVLTKIARIVTGSPKRDSYVDGAVYMTMAGEVALRALEQTPPK